MTYLSDKHSQAVAAIETWLQTAWPGFEVADAADLSAHGLAAKYAGWIIPFDGTSRLILALDNAFPYSLPKTAIAGRDDLLLAPHVESKGKLCTWGPDASFSTDDPVAVAKAYVEASLALVRDNEAGGDIEDYATDFEAYWSREATSTFDLLSIAELRPPSRKLVGWYGSNLILLADTAAKRDGWLKNRYGKFEKAGCRAGMLLWLDPLPRPDDYPTSALDLRRLVLSRDPQAQSILDEIIASFDGRRAVVIAGPANRKRAGAGGLIIRPSPTNSFVAKPGHRGFRKGKVPASIQATQTKLDRTPLQRVNASASRLENGLFEQLQGRRAAIVGCGSLGSGVARLLAQSGVGKIVLFDPETLQWENIGRHELGAEDINLGKASRLAAHLRRRLPHIIECEAHDVSWLTIASTNDALFDDCDIVISATGNWIADCGLNDFIRDRQTLIPTAYGWMERRAMAAHAVGLTRDGPCFRCGFDSTGQPLLNATEWESSSDREQCGGNASPYGASQLNIAQSLLAELAIDILTNRAALPAHRVWLGRRADLERQGGRWSKRWIEMIGSPEDGGRMLGIGWAAKTGCMCA